MGQQFESTQDKTQLSGLYVQISGQGVLISGQHIWQESGAHIILESGSHVIVNSGLYVQISGQGVDLQSGEGVIINSGAPVTIESGSHVIVNSGLYVQISGQGVDLQSGEGVIVNSGLYVQISGQGVDLQSGEGVIVNSGLYVQISGQGVLISGQIINICTPTAVYARTVVVGSISGGIALWSGDVVSLTVRAPSWNSGDIFLGGTDHALGYSPYSGWGMQLEPRDAQSMDLNNPDNVHAFAEVSGDEVLILGINK